MSRLVKKSLSITAPATVAHDGDVLVVKGPKGELIISIPAHVEVKIEGSQVWVSAEKNHATPSAGTVWSLTKNAIEGVTAGFTKTLEIEGVGYTAALKGKDLELKLGYANPVTVAVPPGITMVVEKNVIKILGINKDLVGRAAAEIRALKKPEPYKGKGIHYQGEVIRRKIGKKAGATAAA